MQRSRVAVELFRSEKNLKIAEQMGQDESRQDHAALRP